MKPMIAAALIAFAVTAQAAYAEDDAARAQRWDDLRRAVFGDRPVLDGAGIVSLEAPDRAEDAALVPIGVTLSDRSVKSLYLVIDGNPSPLAGTFRFGPAADPREIRTRVRVDSYTLIHAVAELPDGKLYGVAKFVKASGGCSAPAGSDEAAALARLGRMKLKAVAEAPAGATELQLLVSHPNHNGMQMDQLTRNYTPARFIQTVEVTTGGKEVFTLESDISLSEDPAITFGIVPHGNAPVDIDVKDSAKADFKASFDLPARGS
jgi:sulfur-oxidizing protein SoxY